jgi:hypothetical protein
MVYVAFFHSTVSILYSPFFSFTTSQGNGFAISSVEGAKINITNVCFIDNNFVGEGVVVVQGSTNDLVSTNVFGMVDPELTCPFASTGDDTCVDYDSASCTALYDGNDFHPVVPASSPITLPVPTTSSGVTIKTGISLVCFFSLFVEW